MERFFWAEGEPNSYHEMENKVILLQHSDFLWSDSDGSRISEFDQANKALCECEY